MKHFLIWVTVTTLLVIATGSQGQTENAATIDPSEGCYADPTDPGYRIPVADLKNSTGSYGLCKEGWYCPFYNPANESATWPRICPPSASCVELRIDNKFCDPQGPFEPTPCRPGNYCPVSNMMLRCPAGFFCPIGCTEPYKCSPFAYCPSGTSNEYDMVGIFFVILVDLALVVAFFVYRRSYRAGVEADEEALRRDEEMSSVNKETEEGRNQTTTNMDDSAGAAQLAGSSKKNNNNLQTLFSLFSKAKAGGSSITFRFSDLSVKIPAADVAEGPAAGAVASPSTGSPKSGAVSPATANDAEPGNNINNAEGNNNTLTESATVEKEDKTLLRGVNGEFRPKTVTAIMGPSGAGKTVLLNTLLNKNASSWKQSGELTVNRQLSMSDIRHVVGFVPQDDVLHPELTVEQNLFFSSETRLPQSFTAEDRASLRSEIIKVLDLTHARHIQIGDQSSRGVSGGQRKRCSIGVELAACPSALFLDEPTTGLDAATALGLCSLLQRLSIGTNSTIVMVVHQPRVEIWNALDQVLLLAPGGRTVFQGAQADAKAYFQGALGLNFEAGNPADIILDGIAAQGDLAVEMWDARMQLQKNGVEVAGATSAEEQAVDAPVAGGTAVIGAPHSEEDEEDESAVIPPPRGASFGKQVYLAMHRQFVKINSRLVAAGLDVLLATVCCMVMALAKIREEYVGVVDGTYALLSPKPKVYTLPMISLFYMLAIASGVAPGGIRTFSSDMTQYWREASNGHNRLAYFLGYSLVDLLRNVVSSIHFATVAYLMAEPQQSFWIFWLWIMLLFIIVDSQSAALSMFLSPDNAPVLATIVAIFMSLLNGMPQIPIVGPASYAWWATQGMLTVEMEYLKNIWSVEVLETLAPEGQPWNLNQLNSNIAFLILIYFLYRLAAFLLLIGLNREKQR